MNTVTDHTLFDARRARKFPAILLASVAMCLPLAAARADWEDRWEDYQERLEDEREEAEERWEDQREAHEEWLEDRKEALEDRHERQIIIPYRAGRPVDQPQAAWEEPLPPPQRYRYDGPPRRGPVYRDPAPVYRDYAWDEPLFDGDYRPRGRVYRYYGTPDVGYIEHGRHRTVRVGPFEVHWDR